MSEYLLAPATMCNVQFDSIIHVTEGTRVFFLLSLCFIKLLESFFIFLPSETPWLAQPFDIGVTLFMCSCSSPHYNQFPIRLKGSVSVLQLSFLYFSSYVCLLLLRWLHMTRMKSDWCRFRNLSTVCASQFCHQTSWK